MTEEHNSQNEPYILYGDYLILVGSQLKRQNDEVTGALSATGFTDHRIFFQNMPFHLLNLEKTQSEENLTLIRNYRDFVFQIWPKLNYEANKEYRKVMKEKSKYESMRNSDVKENQKAAEEFEKRLIKIRNRSLEEDKANKSAIDLNRGKTVTYHSEIQLMHVDSGLFIDGKVTTSEADKSASKFELTAEYNSRMIFRILPKYPICKEGDPIHYEDEILLQNTKLDYYVNFTRDRMIDLDVPIKIINREAIPPQPYKSIEMRRIDMNSMRYEALLSQYKETSWRCLFHSRIEVKHDHHGKPWKAIMGGDLIRLRHMDLGGYIAADINYLQENPEVYVRTYHGEFPEEKHSVSEIWEIEEMSIKNRGGEIVSGNAVQTHHYYKLRHYLTGRVMILNDVQMDQRRVIPLLALEKDEKAVCDMGNCVSFIPTVYQTHAHVVHGNPYGLAFNDQKLFLRTMPETSSTNSPYNNYTTNATAIGKGQRTGGRRGSTREPGEQPEQKDPQLLSSYFNPLKDTEFCVKRKPLYLDVNKSAEHAFYIEKVDESEKKDILFVAAALGRLLHLRDVIKAQQKALLTPEYLKKVLTTMEQLIFFIVKAEGDADPYTCEGFTPPQKQRLLKDMRLIEILTDILFYPFALQMYQLNNIPDEFMVKVFQLSYRLIKHTIREYRPNELYASQWLELFIHQSMFSDPNFDLLAEPTLTELIDNNKRILENKINPETIEKFVNMLKTQSPHEKFVKLLRALTVCNGEPMTKNQDELSSLICVDEQARDKLCYRAEIRSSGNVYVFVVPFNEWIELTEFERESRKRSGNTEIYKYFINMMYLLADLCLSRNYIAIDALKGTYPAEICFKIFSEEIYSIEVRSAFAKLYNHLWIDKIYQPVNLPNYLITWEEITEENCKDLFRYQRSTSEFDPFKVFLQDYFQKIAAQGFQKAYEDEINEMTLNLLENCQLLVNFGFYTSINEVAKLLKPLLSILNSMKDVTTPEEEEFRKNPWKSHSFSVRSGYIDGGHEGQGDSSDSRYNSESGGNLIKIKIKVLEIIDKIIMLFGDLHMRRILYEFKKEQQAHLTKTKKFQDKSAQEWIEHVIADKDLNCESYSATPLSVILVDLLLYEDKDLRKLSFQTLYNQHTKRLALKDHLSHVHLVQDPETIKNVEIMKNMGRRLQELVEKTENWYGLSDEAAERTSEEVLKIITTLSDFLQKAESHQRGGAEAESKTNIGSQIFGNIEIDEVFEFGTSYNPDYQKFMRYLNTYNAILDILNYDYNGRFETEYHLQHSSKKDILKGCVKFLARFVAEDRTNQEIVNKHFSLLMKMLKKDPSLGLESVIVELFVNNKTLLNDTTSVQNYLSNVLKLVENIPSHNIRRGKLLRTFNSLMKYKNNVVKRNQTLVINSLSRKEFSNVLFDFSLDRTWTMLKEEFGNYHSQLEENKSPVNLSGELDYLVSLLDVMSVSCEEQNATTESKCQFLFPLKVLKEIYHLANKCYYVKYAVMYFLYHVYLDTEKEMLHDEDEYLSEIYKNMIEDLKSIKRAGWSNHYVRTSKGRINSQKIEEILVFSEIMRNLGWFFSRSQSKELPDFDEILRGTVCTARTFADDTKDYKHQKSIGKLYYMIDKHFKDKIDALQLGDEMLSSKTLNFKDTAHAELTRRKTMLTKLKPENKEEEKIDISDAETHAHKFSSKIETLNQEAFIVSVELEFNTLIHKLVNIEKISEQEEPISFEKTVTALKELVERDEDPLDDEFIAIAIRIFRKIIESEVPGNKAAAEWETKDWLPFAEARVRKRQNELTAFGAVEMVCKMQPVVTNPLIIEELILLAIALLVGGNETSQTAFLEYMKTDNQNDYLRALSSLINRNFTELKIEMPRINDRYARKNLFGEEDDADGKPLPSKRTTITAFQTEVAIIDDDQIQDELKHSVDILVKLFKLLQLTCEGHNLELQNHLRTQTVANGTTNVKSFDFITNSAIWFGSYIKFVNTDCLEFGDQLLDFLIEAVQGPCPDNQTALVSAKIINFCMDYATMFQKKSEQKKRGFVTEADLEKLTASITKAMKLLYSLLEGNTNEKIINQMSHHIEFKYLLSKLEEDFESFCKRQSLNSRMRIGHLNDHLKNKENSFDDQILESFGVFILLQTLADHNKSIEELIKKVTEDKKLKKAYSFFKSNTSSIEIIFNEQHIKVYFPVYPTTRFLSRTSRKKLMDEVNRESQNEKLISLINARRDLFDEMEHLSRLNGWKIKITSKRFNYLRDISTLCALIINLIILFTYFREFDDSLEHGRNGMLKTSYYELFGGDTHSAMKVTNIIWGFGIVQLVSSSFMLVFWFILRVPLMLKQKWRKLIYDNKKSFKLEDNILKPAAEENEHEIEDISAQPTTKTMRLLLTKGPEHAVFHREGKRNFGNLWTKLAYYWINVYFVLSDGSFRYFIFYIIVCVLGLFGPNLVFSLHLLDFMVRYKNLRNIVRAVTLNGKQLLLTSLLGVIFIFGYAIFGFWFLDDMYVNGDNERTCSSMLQCFIVTLDDGFRKWAGIGEVTADPSYESHTRLRFITKAFWELSNYIIVGNIFLSLILAVIIETFSTLRRMKKEQEHDMHNKCYICGIERWKLDKNGKGFIKHISNEHNLWDYIYYLYMLEKKDPLEYNGIETYVVKKVSNEENAEDSSMEEDVSWLPIGKALELVEDENEEEMDGGGDEEGHHHH